MASGGEARFARGAAASGGGGGNQWPEGEEEEEGMEKEVKKGANRAGGDATHKKVERRKQFGESVRPSVLRKMGRLHVGCSTSLGGSSLSRGTHHLVFSFKG